MLKKVIIAGGAATLLSTLTLGVPLFSYARCGVDWLQTSTTDVMPLEWEIKRARQMISDLKPEIEENAIRIAREKVEVSRLESQYSDASAGLEKSRNEITRLTSDLKEGVNQYTYAGKTYTSAQVKADLGSRFKRFKTKSATTDKLNQILRARESSLLAAQDRMTSMMDAKRQLEVEVENLQARLGALRVAQTTSEVSLDDSHLSRTRELLDEIAIRIDVREESLVVDSVYFDEIELDVPDDEELLNEIASFLGSPEDLPAAEAFASIQLN